MRSVTRATEDLEAPDPKYQELLIRLGPDPQWATIWKPLIAWKPSANVLELGAGAGNLAIPLAEHVRRYDVVDADPGLIDYIIGRLPGSSRGYSQRIETFDADMLYDTVVMRSCLLNLMRQDSRSLSLATIRRHLAPDGVFVIEVFDPSWMISETCFSSELQRIDCERQGDLHRVTGHYFFDDLTYEVENDCEVIEVEDCAEMIREQSLSLRFSDQATALTCVLVGGLQAGERS